MEEEKNMTETEEESIVTDVLELSDDEKKESNKIFCVKCGAEILANHAFCPNCGHKVGAKLELESGSEKAEATGAGTTKKSRKTIAIVTVAIVAILIIALGTVGMVQVHKKKEAAKIEEINKKYVANLENATFFMLTGAADAESCGNLIVKVWQNAIYEDEDDETDKYTMENGQFVSDFNDALHNLFVDSSFVSKVNDVKDNQDEVISLMKELKEPPEEHKDAYDSVKELYDAYIALTNLATDPTGSLQTYSPALRDADSEFMKYYEATKLYFGDEY